MKKNSHAKSQAIDIIIIRLNINIFLFFLCFEK
jgi:hypothetical protein